VETIAGRELGLAAPAPERSVVVEVPRPLAPGEKVAEKPAPKREARTAPPAEVRP
jgi:hypothetical protein